MVEMIQNRVRKCTELPEEFKQHAGAESVQAYLKDWRKAHARLGRQIEALQELLEEKSVPET